MLPDVSKLHGFRDEDLTEKSEAELAVLAAKCPSGFIPLIDSRGLLWFINVRVFERMGRAERDKSTLIGRAH